NCLVNVVCVGVMPVDRIIRSRVPAEAQACDFDLILVGKPTDASGFGGVTFASEILDEDEKDRQLGAVQVHDPFLKNILITRKANRMVTEAAFRQGIPIGMKDLGGGGLACAASEICSAGGFGAEVHLDRVHVSMPDLPPEVIACGETQERFIFAVPPDFTPEVLRMYNEVWELPTAANGACARVVGRTTREPRFRLFFHGTVVCDAPIEEVTGGIVYDRKAEPIPFTGVDPGRDTPVPDPADTVHRLIKSLNICSRYPVYRHYDTEVQGMAVLRPGESDAGVMAPLELSEGSRAGLALAVDGNPFIGAVDPYWGGAVAVAEAMRNVVASGAIPRALTDCLCYGNPEKPGAFWQFTRGVQGIADAARRLWQIDTDGEPVPIVSGNVSFYNESALGQAIKPSPIVACVGTMGDYSAAMPQTVTASGSALYLIGQRRDELGGSAYFKEIFGVSGTQPVTVDWEQECCDMHAVAAAIRSGSVVACHDIADGGLAIALAEMVMTHRRPASLGLDIVLPPITIPVDRYLFSESGGFIIACPPDRASKLETVLTTNNAVYWRIGCVTDTGQMVIKHNNEKILELDVNVLLYDWFHGLQEASL
ncbi:phosphoribosylformylglycinamidine synthase, partial [bacterium]|nr:phosphoribosylformylglycinamidine synthase [candidate division CSSED10-310 bacterium]